MSDSKLEPYYFTVADKPGRRKVFVWMSDPIDSREGLNAAAIGAATELHGQGVIDEGEFPVRIRIYAGPEDEQPIGKRLVDMEIRPGFNVYETDEP